MRLTMGCHIIDLVTYSHIYPSDGILLFSRLLLINKGITAVGVLRVECTQTSCSEGLVRQTTIVP